MDSFGLLSAKMASLSRKEEASHYNLSAS